MKNSLIAISLSLIACEAPLEKKEPIQDLDFKELTVTTIESEKEEDDFKEVSPIPDSVLISLSDFDIVLSEYLCYNSEQLENYKSDTIYLDEEVGFNLDSKLLKIIPESDDDRFVVSVAFEQDLRVYVGEKQVKDLDEWHIKEPFIKVPDSAQYYFRLPSYGYEEKEKLISGNLKEIKEAVLQIEGEYIDSSLDTVTDLKRLPIEFWISKIHIKIDYFDSSGNQKTYFLINQSSWGC